MKHLFQLIMLPIMLLCITGVVFSATIKSSYNKLHIDGQIEKGDFNLLRSTYLEATNTSKDNGTYITNIFISSPGGDFWEAIKIADFIEKLKLTVRVSKGDICNSACVFIVIAGAQRILMGEKLGLHRPYITKTQYGTGANKKTEDEQKSVMNYARSWLKDRFVSTDIIDDLISTPSYKVKYVNSLDLLKKIGARSPIHQEWLASLCGFMTDQEAMFSAAYPKYYLYKTHGENYIKEKGWSKDLTWMRYGEETGKIEIVKAAFDKQVAIIECEVVQVKKHIKNYIKNNKI